MVFDRRKLITADSAIFETFHVQATQPLGDILRQGKLVPTSDVMICPIAGMDDVIVVDKTQASYHHIIQGERNGQPWMLSF